MKKQYRINKKSDFEKLFEAKKIYFSRFLIVKSVPNDLAYPRFGMIISTKVSKRAVDRNKIRRRIREIFHLHFNEIKPGVDILAIAKSSMLKLTYKETESEVLKGLKYLHLT